ncbi:MAG: hypothetical protein JJU32_12185 [Phormidium sp. BM_Day4_Bin.17]|nr:hypothetical protein [Phormidium sp. BM_Day4_Bin.17]UCJ11279.1 MAG: hypothetical protein JWS08_16050 [Phormidium sp. PBR-2020]
MTVVMLLLWYRDRPPEKMPLGRSPWGGVAAAEIFVGFPSNPANELLWC